MQFSELGLSEKVLHAVEDAGYKTPTPIQAQAIPHVLAGRDVLGIAQTGTGKTAAFTLPMLCRLEQGRARARMPRTLILEPTRELAAQVEESFNKYGAQHKLNVALLIGGVAFGDQETKIMRGADVLIVTPGRLLDFFERGKLLLNGIEILVIDEADRMLDMGFIPDIEKICKLVPFTRQTLFFSATMPPEITRLTEQFLHNPARVEVARAATTASTIIQALVASHGGGDKRETLRRLLRSAEGLKNAIVFCNRKRDVAIVYKSLEKHGFPVGALHGDMDQQARMASLDAFKNGAVDILVCSDVAARGLDIPDVSHVFNFDVPTHSEDYVHRIGRTGRAGRAGHAFTIVTEHDRKYVAQIEDLIKEQIDWAGPRLDELAPAEYVERDRGRAAHAGERSRRNTRGRAERDTAGRPARERKPKVEEAARETREAAPRQRTANRSMTEEPRRKAARRPVEDDAPVIGMGDHVPSFLLRPVRTKNVKTAE
ncbi:DEAD/DEAH box helicase [Rhodoblastus acidophilus]|uniref:DEAD/DEAH box helicase n=1 Tax=Candidatus Rhodoblastus alkanivorans TaxID=2954117 RepID=A0ABS9Z9T8_9HYPH|nr:DEAD/DEAH box helicase [Candidatus Rhodoblastus alkanivorans]MCI4680138.1 DEAD/DEAH box helicase [Candidatus Rhodoblastus alkanivorans]MCI4683392.1 DEAD/DEAH box helicase [Candidatus Rhodoblastus alkanivorans]MDI4640702.1 DEAD/DEAH box helicase [Rhodoblastus acidophilus]